MTAVEAVVPESVSLQDRAPKRGPLRRLLREPLAVTTIVYLSVVIVAGLAAPLLAGSPNVTRLDKVNAPPFDAEYLLGGDSSGRDIYARLLSATRATLLGSLEILIVSILLGATTGIIAGYVRGRFERTLDWISDVVLALPGIVLLIALYSLTGPNVTAAMAVFGLLVAPSYFRIIRGVVVGVRRELFVDAARVAGMSNSRIILGHIFWAVRPAIIIQSAFVLSAGVAVQAALEFLGLGNPGQPSWGGMLQESFSNLYNNGYSVIWPASAITLTTLAFVLLGNALRDALQVGAGRVRRQRSLELDNLIPVPGTRPSADVVLGVSGLRIAYPKADGEAAEVVKGVDLDIRSGEIHGLVGESGSGKSQTAFACLGILPKNARIVGGSVYFDGVDLLRDPNAMKQFRGRRISYIPQEPMTNLDPTFTVGAQLVLGIRAATGMSRKAARKEVLRLFGRVGIHDTQKVFRLYPFEISGGMAQRVLITGAIATNPDLLIADEPTTALDVTVQADVLELIRELRDERGLGVLLVTHNMGVVADLCDRVSVMKSGTILEHASAEELFANPQHEYTRELLDSILDIRGTQA